MKGEPPRLDQIQCWMQSVITHPGGVTEGVDSPQARQYVDITLGELERMIQRSRSLSSADRLEIYVNAYHARLLECLDEEFAATRYALGEDLFEAVAFGYLQHYPSHSYTLGQLGAKFPAYLAESRLHAAGMPDAAPSTWPDFIIELATLERSLYEVYDGPGTEQSGTLTAADLAAIGPDDWPTVRLVPAACLLLHALEHPVSEYWGQYRDEEQPTVPEPERNWLAVSRRNYIVERHPLSADEFVLLCELCGGAPLAVAIEATAAASTDEAALAANLGGWFARWTAAGFFTGVQPAGA